MFCTDISSPILFFISDSVPTLVYYSHVPTIFIVLFLCLFVYIKNKNLESKLLLGIAITFSVWLTLNLILWTNVDSRILMFVWTLFGVVNPMLFILCLYFMYVYVTKNDINYNTKIIWVLLAIPSVLLSSFVLNFNMITCEVQELSLYSNYVFIIELALTIWLVVFSLYKLRISKGNVKKQIAVMFSGMVFFLVSFFTSVFVASYLGQKGVSYAFTLEQYGFFGMTIFMAFLAYLIVKFKAFHIKLLWAQALVWALVILIGSQFAFVRNNTNKILTAVTLVISTILGLMLVRGVKREIAQREEIESLATNLEKANEGQSNLLHFITHQVKGYFTKSRNVFAELSTGDYGKLPEPVEIMVKEGFRSTTEGVDLVHNMLNAANIERGTMKYNKEDVDLKESLLDVIKQKKISIEEKGLKLITNIGEGNLVISGDPLQIKEVMKNLIENSIRYTLKGSVEVGLELKGNKILFNVKDTGVGVSAEDMPKLFKKGGHGSESTKVNPESTGYGLYIVKEIVEKHDGRVWVESEGKGKGSTFFVEFPLSK